MEKDYIQLPPMPSDTPTELVAIVWIYVKMEEPEKVQILDFIRENVKPGTNEGEKEKLMELMEKSKLNPSPYVEEFHSLMQELIGRSSHRRVKCRLVFTRNIALKKNPQKKYLKQSMCRRMPLNLWRSTMRKI